MMTRFNPLFAFSVLIIAVLACVSPEFVAVVTDTPVIPQATATPAFFTAGTLFLFPDQAVFSGVETVGAFYDFCIPPNIAPNDLGSGSFVIGEFGAILGQCKGVSPDETLHREGVLTGSYNALERFVTFRLETVRIFSPHPDGRWMAVLTFEGNGPVVGNTASGVGNFDFSCTAEGTLVYCLDDLTSLQSNGTMPFQIDFSP